MKKRVLLLGLCSLYLQAWANTNPVLNAIIPDYARSNHPSCSCDCDHKIIYKGGNVTQKTLDLWAKEAVVTSYSFGFGNYETALRKASQYFTPHGWESFREALNQSGNLDLILQNHLLVSAIPAGEPVLVENSEDTRNRSWQIQIPLVMKYDSSSTTVSKPVTAILSVVQTNPNAGLQGLGIEQFVIQPRKTG